MRESAYAYGHLRSVEFVDDAPWLKSQMSFAMDLGGQQAEQARTELCRVVGADVPQSA
jgi:hypothetical protein